MPSEKPPTAERGLLSGLMDLKVLEIARLASVPRMLVEVLVFFRIEIILGLLTGNSFLGW